MGHIEPGPAALAIDEPGARTVPAAYAPSGRALPVAWPTFIVKYGLDVPNRAPSMRADIVVRLSAVPQPARQVRPLRTPEHLRRAWFRIMLLYRHAAARQELSPILVVRRFMHWSTSVLHGAILLALQLCTSTAALAQLAPAPAVDRCGGQARRVARFAAQAHRWSVALPVVVPVGKLAKGVIFRATANPACCELNSACGASSEVADALIGMVDERLFALTKNPPDWQRMPPKPWRADKWSEFLAVAGAGPRDAKEALALVWLVLSSIRPRLGRLDDGAALATLVAA